MILPNQSIYALVHSPLVGPLTWRLVADELRQRGFDVLVPVLADASDSQEPFWKQHTDSVLEALIGVPGDTPVILVAHSGAGPLLPVIGQSIKNPITAYVFVDAGIPRHNATRLDLMYSEDSDWAKQFQEYLESGGRFPDWSSDALREIIPDPDLRKQMVAEINPWGRDFFTEPIPVFDGWTDALCIYIQFSAPYEKPAQQARQAGWPTYKLEAGHFHMLVDAKTVANMIVDAVNNQF